MIKPFFVGPQHKSYTAEEIYLILPPLPNNEEKEESNFRVGRFVYPGNTLHPSSTEGYDETQMTVTKVEEEWKSGPQPINTNKA